MGGVTTIIVTITLHPLGMRMRHRHSMILTATQIITTTAHHRQITITTTNHHQITIILIIIIIQITGIAITITTIIRKMAGILFHSLRMILTIKNIKMFHLAFSLQSYVNTTGIPRGILEVGTVIAEDGTVTRITMKTVEVGAETNGDPMNLDLPTQVRITIMDGITLEVMAVAVTVVAVVVGEEVTGTILCLSKDVSGLTINQGQEETMVSHLGSHQMVRHGIPQIHTEEGTVHPEAQCPPWHIWLGDLDIIHMEYHLVQQHQRMIL